MIEFVNIADHQDESAGLPSIEIFVLQKIPPGSILGHKIFVWDDLSSLCFFFEIQKSRIQSGVSGSQLDSSSSWHRGNV